MSLISVHHVVSDTSEMTYFYLKAFDSKGDLRWLILNDIYFIFLYCCRLKVEEEKNATQKWLLA